MNKKASLTSKEVRSKLKIRACDLMHLRENGVLRAIKKGNAYLYDESDVVDYQNKHLNNKEGSTK